MQIQRYINIKKELRPGKVLVLLGPRRTGKTTLLKEFIAESQKEVAFYQGDQLSIQNAFSISDSSVLDEYVGDYTIIAIDEAQMIPNIGASLKIIVDTHPDVAVIVTGSSAFELAGQVGEPLTGRKTTKYLLPISVDEWLKKSQAPQRDFKTGLEDFLIYGMYPDVLVAKNSAQKKQFLQELIDSYLLKDIFAFQEVKGAQILVQLLSLLAFQIGGLVSATELGNSLGINRRTVERYLDLLEKAFVIYRLPGLSRNLRSEITRKSKYYFYDVGIRNALIGNMNDLNIRNDVGQLWENFVITERLKYRKYHTVFANQYFWRTWEQNEIDLVEERDGKYIGYECKWGDKKMLKAPNAWVETYADAQEWHLMTPATALGYIRRFRSKGEL